MNSKNLDNLEGMGKIKKEEFTIDFIIGRCELASKRIENAKLLLKNNGYDERVFISACSELYSSFRILCEVMLAMCGYRVEKSSGHHGLAISTIRPLNNSSFQRKSAYLSASIRFYISKLSQT